MDNYKDLYYLLFNRVSDIIEQLKNTPWADNTAVSLITIDDNNNMKLEFYNNTEHLPTEFLPKSSSLNNYKR